jgi:hypothetical protein
MQNQSRPIKFGTTNVTIVIRLFDPDYGEVPVAGLTIANLQIRYIRNETDNDVTISAWQSLTALSALTDAHTDNYGYEIGNGYYRIDIPDAVCATGINEAVVLVQDSVGSLIMIGSFNIIPDLTVDINSNVSEILTDTGTTLNAKIDTIDTNIDTIDGIVDTIKATTDAIVIDTETTLSAKIDVIDGIADELKVAVITNAIGTDIAADIIAVKADTAAILTDTGTTLDTKINTIDTVVDAIKVKTDQLVFTASTVNANLTGGSIGSGSSIVSYYVFTDEDAETGPISNCSVWVSTDSGGSTVVASGLTDTNGMVTFYLDPTTYYIWKSKSGYTFTNPDTEIVT